MIDHRIQGLQRRLLSPPARALHARGWSADQLTLAGFACGTLAFVALALGLETAGLCLVLVNRLLDGLDGSVARLDGPTDRGAFLDICCDFLFYALVPLGFAFADPDRNALAAAILIAAFVGTGSSFLAFAAVAAKRGMAAAGQTPKGIYYLGGLTEGAETIALFIGMCLWPQHFPALAIGFAALCMITTLTRWREGWREFGTLSRDPRKAD